MRFADTDLPTTDKSETLRQLKHLQYLFRNIVSLRRADAKITATQLVELIDNIPHAVIHDVFAESDLQVAFPVLVYHARYLPFIDICGETVIHLVKRQPDQTRDLLPGTHFKPMMEKRVID